MKRFSTKLDAYIRKNRLAGDDAAEIKALVMLTSRSLDRRIQAGVMGQENIREALEDALYAQIVEREGLITVEDWGELTDEDNSDAEQQPLKGTSVAEIVNQLKDMFPQAPAAILLAAAQSSSSLDEAAAKLTAPTPRPRTLFVLVCVCVCVCVCTYMCVCV